MPINRFVLFFALMSFGVLIDLISKSLIFARYYDPNRAPRQYWLIEGILGIETSTNGGALFGMGQGYHFWFAGLSFVAIVGVIAWLFLFRAAKDRFLTVALGLICGGILGNLYDRLGFGYTKGFPEETQHHVRDWIHFRIEGLPLFDPWPNFNIADSLLVCGAAALFIHAFFFHKPSKPKDRSEAKKSKSKDD